MTRRQFLTGMSLLGGLVGLQTWRNWPQAGAFEDHPAVPGFLRLSTPGEASGPAIAPGAAFLVGIDAPGEAVPDAVRDGVAADPLAALYSDTPPLRMAYFTDIRCPICRPFEARLDQLEAETPGLTRITHELPIFGEASELAARALIAAGPDLAAGLRPRLQRTPAAVTEPLLRGVIESLGADPDPVLATIHTPEVNQQLHRSRALADLFGFFGTPALVLGRAAMLGAQPIATLRAARDLNLDV